MGVVCVRLPEVPVTVTVNVPRLALLLAVSVTVLELVAGFGLNDAVTPFGKPEAGGGPPGSGPLPNACRSAAVRSNCGPGGGLPES